ncbi:MAG: PAS domain S-box protein, partial [Williamsia sp.]|nr:PAS domain S-box protein [Williamsia sp.]
MKQSESQRTAIVKRLLSLNLSTKQELQDIVQLTSIICETPTVLISLLGDEKQHLDVRLGFDGKDTPVEDAFCLYTIQHDEVMEVPDAMLDSRFTNNNLVTGGPRIRFYAGSPLKTQSGEKLGSLCVIDTKPNKLNAVQKQMLAILARQVTTILEFELSLKVLKEEVDKVQESEMKLKSIFQSSPTAHILLGKDRLVRAFNKAAADFIKRGLNQTIEEGAYFFLFIRSSMIPVFSKMINGAFAGERQVMKEKLAYETGDIWWDIRCNPVYDAYDQITGVSIDASDITGEMQDKQNILTQNTALQQIAQMQ